MIRIRPAARWFRDDRGAVAVIGLLMAVLLVGLLWYVVGVGNAVAARERAQEAADAAAFSTAVGQARGMNLLVLINLILSVVVGIRLVIMVMFATLGILVAILTALSFLPFVGGFFAGLLVPTSAAFSAFAAASRVQRPIIGAAMEGLGVMAEGVTTYGEAIATVTPKFIARGYEPIVKVEGGYVEPADPLPVEVDLTGGTLCGKAADAFDDILTELFKLFGLGGMGSVLGRIMGIARPMFANDAGALFFCGLGGNVPEFDLPPEASDAIEKACEESTECQAIEAAQRELKNACIDKCYEKATLGSIDAANGALGEASEAVQGALGLDTPQNRRVRKADVFGQNEWVNGEGSAQYLAVLSLNLDEATKIGPAGVIVGGFGRGNLPAVSPDVGVAFAQAELYYDCDGAWSDDVCNGGDEALWNFRWRGRLRMVNPGTDEMKEVAAKFESAARARWTGPGSGSLQSIQSLVVH
jgi:uncharacterized membrane protein